MADDYKSFYLKDLIQIIEHAALDLMGAPIIAGKKADGTLMNLTEVAQQNSLTAMENSGIRMLARALIEELQGVGDDNA